MDRLNILMAHLNGVQRNRAKALAHAICGRLTAVFAEFPMQKDIRLIEFVPDFSKRVALMVKYFFVSRKLKAETKYISDDESFVCFETIGDSLMKPGSICAEVKGLTIPASFISHHSKIECLYVEEIIAETLGLNLSLVVMSDSLILMNDEYLNKRTKKSKKSE